MKKFREDHRFQILLSSKVGSEGLDFQFCNTLFNYDLPWNPMEIEQRIGRLDRIGQKSQVIRIYNFWIEGTIEKRILDKLFKRIGIFERSIGELELILGDELRTFERDILTKKLTREDEKKLLEQKEVAIESRKNELERLKKNSAKFIGTDEFFNHEVDMIKKRRRFITSEQLRRFVTDFLKNNCPRTILKYCPNKNHGYLYPDSKLRSIITADGISEDLLKFLDNIDAEIPISFDPQTAFNNPSYEFINVFHPLTQSIVEYYSKSGEFNSNAHCVALRTKKLKKGDYIYFIYRLRIHAATGGDTLEMVILGQNLKCACSEEDAEIILGEMIEIGEDSKDTVDKFDRIFSQKACHKASKVFLERIDNIRKEIKRNNDVFIDKRIQSLNTSYDNYINKKILLPQNVALEGEERDKYFSKLRGAMRKFELEFRQKEQNLENQRKLQVEYDDISAGILQII